MRSVQSEFFWNEQKEIKLSMFDPLEIYPQSHRRATIDYLNARYHGQVRQNQPYGMGMLLDHHFMLVVSQWQSQQNNSSSFIIFPENTIFWGQIQNKLPNQFCTYKGHNLTIYAYFKQQQQLQIAIEAQGTSTINFIRVPYQIYQQLLSSTNEQLLEECFKSNKISQNPPKQYTSNTHKHDILCDFFSKQIHSDHNYRNYLYNTFHKEQSCFQIVQNKTEICFGFKRQSIVCRMVGDQRIRIKTVGYCNGDGYELYKKDGNTGLIEQKIGQHILRYPKIPLQRPKQSVKLLHKHYKQSLNYHNDYFKIDYFYRIKFIFSSIETLFHNINLSHTAQQLLENPNEISKSNSKSKSKQNSYDQFSMYAIEEVKEDIINRLVHSRRSLPISHRSVDRIKKIQQTTKSKQLSRKSTEYSRNKVYKYSPSRYNRHLVGTCQHSQSLYQTSQRPHTINRHKDLWSTPRKSQQIQYIPHTVTSTKKANISRSAYFHQKSQRVNTKRIQNTKNLTNFYEQIEKDSRFTNSEIYQTPRQGYYLN